MGIGVIRENDNVDSFGSDPELSATETESGHSSSDNGEDGHGGDGDVDHEKVKEEDSYQRILEYTL